MQAAEPHVVAHGSRQDTELYRHAAWRGMDRKGHLAGAVAMEGQIYDRPGAVVEGFDMDRDAQRLHRAVLLHTARIEPLLVWLFLTAPEVFALLSILVRRFQLAETTMPLDNGLNRYKVDKPRRLAPVFNRIAYAEQPAWPALPLALDVDGPEADLNAVLETP